MISALYVEISGDNLMEKLFKIQENGTSIRTEIFAGLTTFMTMAYIIALNPNILTDFAVGTPLWNGVFMATCLTAALGTMCMAFIANKPFVMAPGMGINSFFASVVASIAAINGTSYESAFHAGLCIVFIEGAIFIVLSVLSIREKIVNAIPACIRLGTGPAIGLMIMNIGFGSNVGIYAEGNGYTSPFYVMRDFFGSLTPMFIRDKMGAEYVQMVITVITMIIGLIVIVLFAKKGVKAAVLLGIFVSSIIYWACDYFVLGNNPFASLENASFTPPFGDMVSTTLFKFDFPGLLNIGIFTAITLVITFCMIDMFDTIGTLIGAATRGGMVDENGDMPRLKQALLSDAIGTFSASCAGSSTVTTFVESSSGIAAGGRTGLTAFTAAVLFLAAIFLAPVAALIPPAATSAALIYVGILMLQSLSQVNYKEIDQAVPIFIMLLAMPISGSIGHGIGLAMICYSAIKLFSGKGREVSALTYGISILFLVKFFLVV